MRPCFFAVFLAACAPTHEAGGTAVGNPNLTSVRLALPIEQATAADAGFLVHRCHGLIRSTPIADIDLAVGPGPKLPAGPLCGLSFFHGPITGDLQAPAGQVSLSINPQILNGQDLIFELGEPGFEEITGRAALFSELVPDGLLDPIERSQGAIAATPEHTNASPAPADALLQVGTDGQRVLRTEVQFPDYPTEQPATVALYAAAYGDGTWMTVGGDNTTGVSSISTDGGLTWTDFAHNGHLNGVAYQDGAFIATSSFGTLERFDGSWNPVSAPAITYKGIAASVNGFVAVAGLNVAISSDGLAWQEVALPGTIGVGARAVAGNNQTFVVVGDGGYRASSPDGLLWTEVVTGGGDLRSIAWNGEEFYAVGEFESWRSPDANLWFSGANLNLNAIVSHQGEWICMDGQGELFYEISTNQWARKFSSPGTGGFFGLASSAP